MIVTLHTPGTRGMELQDAIVEQLAALELELFDGGAWSESMLRQEFAAPARTYILDLDDDAPGAVAPQVRAYGGFWHDGIDVELMTIGVAKSHQGQGVGSRLLDALVERARLLGARRMLLEVRIDNLLALGLYRSFGFTMLGVRKRYYQPEGVDAYTMALDIAAYKRLPQANAAGWPQQIIAGSTWGAVSR